MQTHVSNYHRTEKKKLNYKLKPIQCSCGLSFKNKKTHTVHKTYTGCLDLEIDRVHADLTEPEAWIKLRERTIEKYGDKEGFSVISIDPPYGDTAIKLPYPTLPDD